MRNDRSFIELRARERAHALLDDGSYRELLDPFDGIMSPWLGAQGIVPQSDDGMVVGTIGLLVKEQVGVLKKFFVHQDFRGQRNNIALIATGHRAQEHFAGAAGENVVAICDVNEQHLAAAARKFPGAKQWDMPSWIRN